MEAGDVQGQHRLLRRTAGVGDEHIDSVQGRHGDRAQHRPCSKISGSRLGEKAERVERTDR